jgi:uncharacterized protein (UPF0333 family)
MRVTNIQQLIFVLFIGVVIGYVLSNSIKSEGFQAATNAAATDSTCH